jgi:hypothetical protein
MGQEMSLGADRLSSLTSIYSRLSILVQEMTVSVDRLVSLPSIYSRLGILGHEMCLVLIDLSICLLIVPTLIKKDNTIFLVYKEIQNGAVAMSYMTNGLLMHIWGNVCAFPHI